MSRTLPLPTGIYKRPFFKSSTVKWLSALPLLGLGFFLLLSIRQIYVSRAVDLAMPCGAAKNVIPTLDAENLDEKQLEMNQHKPVMVVGTLHPEELVDTEFALRYPGVFLRRSVEMYQWSRDGTEYRRHWFPNVIDSSSFTRGHLNPLAMPFHDSEIVASPIRIGELSVSQQLNPQFIFAHRVALSPDDLERLPTALQGTFRVIHNYFFRGRDMRYPSVGDVRVSFSGIARVNITVIAKLEGKELSPCDIENQPEGAHHNMMAAMVVSGHKSLVEMRLLFAESGEHGFGVPWWLIGLGILHIVGMFVVGFMALTSSQRGRSSRSD